MINFQRRFFITVSVLFFMVGSFGCSGGDVENMIQQGDDAVTAGNLDEAVIWFKKAIQQDPEMALVHYKIGQVYHKRGEVRLAFAELNRALQQDTKLSDARKELAFLLVENRALEQAVKVCEQFLEVNGNDHDIYMILGNSLVYLKKFEEAVKVLEEGRELYPESLILQLNFARLLVVKGDIEGGRALMETLALENEGDITIQIALAQMYERLERFDLAVLTLENVKEKFSDNPLPYFLLAQLSLKKDQPDQAKEILLDAEKKGIKDPQLYRMFAMILQRQGDSENAVEYFKKAVDVATDEARQTNQMILVDYYTYLKKYKEAQEVLETVIAEDDSKKVLKSKIVELFMAQGEFDQARASVDALLKEDSSDARGHYLKGLMMMKERDVAEARKSFSKAKDLAPNAAENQFLYGVTFMEESEQISITEISEALQKNPNLLKARLALAELYAKKGDFQQSLDELEKILSRQTANNQLNEISGKQADNIKTRVLRIAVLLKMGKPDVALKDAKLLVEQQQTVSGHKLRLAEVYFVMGKYDEALPLYEILQKEKPESAQLLNRIVSVLMMKKEHEKAMEVTDSFLAKYPDNSAAVMIKAKIYLSQGYIDLAENVLKPEADKDQDVGSIVMLAELYKNKKEDGKAIEYFQKGLQQAPNNVGIMMKLANLYLANGKPDEAIVHYEKVLQEKDDFIPAMNNLAFLYAEESGDLDRALDLATRVYKKLPDNPDIADTLGWVYVMKGVFSQAEPYLKQAMDGRPDNPSILYHVAMLRYGQRQQREAEKLLISAIEKGLSAKELASANETLDILSLGKKKLSIAQSEKEQGNVDQAIVLFEEIMQDEGFNSDAAIELALLYAEQNKKMIHALELAQKAYDAQPSNPQAADALGWVYYHQGSLLLAKQYLEKALDNDGEYALARIHLGTLYLKKDEPANARKELEIAKSMKLSASELQSVEEMLQGIDN